MLYRKGLAWLFTTVLCAVIYSFTIPAMEFLTLLNVLPFAIAAGGVLSIIIELVTRRIHHRKLTSLLLHLAAAYLVYKAIMIPIWSVVVYLFAFPIASMYWIVDELLRKKDKLGRI